MCVCVCVSHSVGVRVRGRELKEVEQLSSVHGPEAGVVLTNDSVSNVQFELLQTAATNIHTNLMSIQNVICLCKHRI